MTAQEEVLIKIVRGLPPEQAQRVVKWAQQLAGLAPGGPLEWSDAWKDEDLADATAASFRNFEEQERGTS